MTQLAMSGKKMRCNTPNEDNNSPLENYKVIFRRSTPKGGGGQNSSLRIPHSTLNKYRTNYELFYCSSVSQKIGGRGALSRRWSPKCHLFFLSFLHYRRF